MGAASGCIKSIFGLSSSPPEENARVTYRGKSSIILGPRESRGGKRGGHSPSEVEESLLPVEGTSSSRDRKVSSSSRSLSSDRDGKSATGLERKEGKDDDSGQSILLSGKYMGKTYGYVKDNDWDYCKFILVKKGEVMTHFYEWILNTPEGKKQVKQLRVSSVCQMKCPELKEYIDRVKETEPDKIYEPGVLTGEYEVMARYGWFIDYVVRWALYVECKKRRITVNKFTCQTWDREEISTSLGRLLNTKGDMTEKTLQDLWTISFSSILQYKNDAVDIPMPKGDRQLIEKVTTFARAISMEASSSKAKIDMSHMMKGKLISGEADIIVGDCVIDIKLYISNCLDMMRHWVQVLLYAMLRIDEGYPVNSVAIYDVNAGLVKTVKITKEDIVRVREFVSRIAKESGH